MTGTGDLKLGRRALSAGFLTPEQLQAALVALAASGEADGRLGPWLLERKLLTPEQLASLEPPPLLRPGAAFDKYRLVRELGRGGVGAVFEAVDGVLQRKVALKLLLRPKEEGGEDRFFREARLSARLPKHPNVVHVYDVGETDGRLFLAMEFIEGREWSAWTEGRPLRAQIVALRKIALALHHAHEHGVIHRDLKPANVLVDAAGEPHVTDFGLAKPVEAGPDPALTREGFAVGTPLYMSPEQAAGQPVDRRSDVHSLGLLLYELLTGRRPFEADSAAQVLASVLRDAPPPPTGALKAGIDPVRARALEALCLSALQKDPAKRPPSAFAFADALGRWLEPEAGPATRRELRAARPAASRLVPVLAAVAVAAVAAVAVLASRPPRIPTQAPPSPPPPPAPVAAPPPAPPPLRRGAVGEYFSDPGLKSLAFRRLDAWIDFRWAEQAPELRLPRDGFSARWRGLLRAPSSGIYLLQTTSDDGVRVRIDGVERISNWKPHPPTTDTAALQLEAGEHRVELEYFDSMAGAEIALRWQPPGTDSMRPAELWHREEDFAAHPRTDVDGLLHEGEWLKRLEPFTGLFGAQRLKESAGIRGRWSADAQAFWTGGKPRDVLRLEFLSPVAGARTLAMAFTRSSDYAIVRLRINGATIAPSVDLYEPSVRHGGEQVFRDVALQAGPNLLEVEIVGSNPAAKPFMANSALHQFGLDYLAIR